MILKIFFKIVFDKIYLKTIFTNHNDKFIFEYLLRRKNTRLMNIFKTNVFMYFFFKIKTIML